jgi:hypothetical protein
MFRQHHFFGFQVGKHGETREVTFLHTMMHGWLKSNPVLMWFGKLFSPHSVSICRMILVP